MLAIPFLFFFMLYLLVSAGVAITGDDSLWDFRVEGNTRIYFPVTRPSHNITSDADMIFAGVDGDALDDDSGSSDVSHFNPHDVTKPKPSNPIAPARRVA